MATTIDNDAQGLRTLFTMAEKLKSEIEGSYDYNSEQYKEKLRNAIGKYEKCKEISQAVGLFSPNESIEDLVSSELRFMLLDFNLGELVMKEQSRDPQVRKNTIARARRYYERFLKLCDDYDLITTKEDKGMYEVLVVQQAMSPVALNSALPADPGVRRQAKIARFKQEKDLKTQLETLSKIANEDYSNIDENIIRKLFLTKLSLGIMEALQAIQGILLEFDVLRLAPPIPPEHLGTTSQQVPDDRERRRQEGKDQDTYSERLDHPSVFRNGRGGGALLDPKGRPLQPFTFVDKRDAIRKGVFRPGHNLPTMTIDEYLEEEKRRGNIIEGGGEKSGLRPEPDEDNYEKADEETMKARKWDEFTEENTRGSGNRMNMG